MHMHTINCSTTLQTYIKLEQYGYAIQDADTAIELDPNNVKVLYTRTHFDSIAAHGNFRHFTAAPQRTRPS
jgi:hypothetical protein